MNMEGKGGDGGQIYIFAGGDIKGDGATFNASGGKGTVGGKGGKVHIQAGGKITAKIDINTSGGESIFREKIDKIVEELEKSKIQEKSELKKSLKSSNIEVIKDALKTIVLATKAGERLGQLASDLLSPF